MGDDYTLPADLTDIRERAAALSVSSSTPGVLVCVGEACLEYIGHTEAYPAPGTRNYATHSFIGGGGKAANAAVAFSRLAKGRDITARLITRVGRDPAGARADT